MLDSYFSCLHDPQCDKIGEVGFLVEATLVLCTSTLANNGMQGLRKYSFLLELAQQQGSEIYMILCPTISGLKWWESNLDLQFCALTLPKP